MELDYPEMGDQITMIMLFCERAERAVKRASLGSGIQYMALRYIIENSACSKGDVAKALGVAQSALASNLGQLVSGGFVRAFSNGVDGRVSCLRAAPSGLRAVSAAEELLDGSLDAMLERVPSQYVRLLDMGMVASAISMGCSICDGRGFNRAAAYAESSFRFISKLTKITQEFGLSLNGYRILLYLGSRGPVSSKAVRLGLAMSASTESSLLRVLRDRGLVEVSSGVLDRRQKDVCLTSEGRRLLVEAFRAVEDYFIYGPKRSTPAEREMYGRLAKMLVRAGAPDDG